MNQAPVPNFVLRGIERRGRRFGAPTVVFPDRTVSVPGGIIYVLNTPIRWLTGINGFFLALPPNVFGLVIFPDGTSHNMAGGIHQAPVGLYKLQYVDGHERLEFLPPVSEVSTDGEKVTLKLVLRYQVDDPLQAFRIDHPVETLIEHVEADVAQYIRTHHHNDIVDSSNLNQENKLLAFIVERHNRRFPPPRAFIITSIEIKDFSGDEEYLDLRRKADLESRKSEIEKEQARLQQELLLLKTQYKAESERMISEHAAELTKKETGYRVDLENLEARHEREKHAILEQVRLHDIDLNNKRMQLQRSGEEFTQIIELFARQFSSGVPVNPAAIKTMAELLAAYKEKMNIELFTSPSKDDSVTNGEHDARSLPDATASNAKVKTLTNTLLNLLNPKK